MLFKKISAFWIPCLLFTVLIAFCIFSPVRLSAIADRAILNTLHKVPAGEPPGTTQGSMSFLERFILIYGGNDTDMIPLARGKRLNDTEAYAEFRQQIALLQQLQLVPDGDLRSINYSPQAADYVRDSPPGYAYYHIRPSDPAQNAISWQFDFYIGESWGNASLDEESGKIVRIAMEHDSDPAAFSGYEYIERWAAYWGITCTPVPELEDSSVKSEIQSSLPRESNSLTFAYLQSGDVDACLMIQTDWNFMDFSIINYIERFMYHKQS